MDLTPRLDLPPFLYLMVVFLQATGLGGPASVKGNGGGIRYPLDVPVGLCADGLEGRISSRSESLHQHVQGLDLHILLLDLLNHLDHGLVTGLGSRTSRLFESSRSSRLSRDGISSRVCQGQDGVVHGGMDMQVVCRRLRFAQERGSSTVVPERLWVQEASEGGGAGGAGLLLTIMSSVQGLHDLVLARDRVGVLLIQESLKDRSPLWFRCI